MFFNVTMQRFLLGLTQIVFNISLPNNVQHMFKMWVNQVGGKLKRQLLVGLSGFCWAIWLSRNNIDKSPIKSFMYVFYKKHIDSAFDLR
jgi:hypothetical protein